MKFRIMLSLIVAPIVSVLFYSCYENNNAETVSKEKYDSLLAIVDKHPDVSNNRFTDKIKPGAWVLNYYVNEFGIHTVDPYIFSVADGSMTTLGISESNLNVRIVIDRNSIRIQMYMADGLPVRNEGTIFYKVTAENAGKEYVFETINDDKGNNTLFPKYKKMFLNMISENTGKLLFSATSERQGVYKQYMFVIEDTPEFKKGMQKLDEIHQDLTKRK